MKRKRKWKKGAVSLFLLASMLLTEPSVQALAENVITSHEADAKVTSEQQTQEGQAKEENSQAESGEPGSLSSQTGLEEQAKEELSFEEYIKAQGKEVDELKDDEADALKVEYIDKMAAYAGDRCFDNGYLEVAVADDGKFTIGNIEGNPSLTSDNYRILLFGHPNPSTSETRIKIGDYETIFRADSVNVGEDSAVAVMNLDEYGVQIFEILKLVSTGNASYADSVRIGYKVINTSNRAVSVGIRIMLDTMLASNDCAPFKISGIGNMTTCWTYEGSEIPSSYQVYDDLDMPTTVATGYLKRAGERSPDKVQFANWRRLRGATWNYTQSNGAALSDSAVAVYFNPVQIAPGGSTDVATYYGIGLGGSIQAADGSAEQMSGDAYKVVVKDSLSGSYLSDVTVSVEGIAEIGEPVAQTGTDGAAVYRGLSRVSERGTVRLSKEGYQDREISTVIKGGAVLSAAMKNNADTTPLITTVTLERASEPGAEVTKEDILTNTVNFIEDKNGLLDREENAKKLGHATVKAAADMDNCVYQLIQNESVLEQNTTGIFTLKTLKTSSGTYIEKLEASGNRYIRAVSADGKKSQKMRIGLRVSQPTVTMSGITDVDLWPYGEAGIAKNTLGAILLGDSVSFGIKDPVSMKVAVTDDGKVQVGLNLKKMPESAAKGADLFDQISKGALSFNQKNEYVKVSKVSMGTIHPYVEFYGYGEATLKDGKIAKVDLIAQLSGGVDASYTVNCYTFIIPCYVTIGAGGNITATIQANVYNENGITLPTVYSGTVSPSVYLSIEGGVGAKGVANIGVEGKGELAYQYDFVTKYANATLTGTATLKAAVWKFEKSIKFAEGTVTIYDSNAASLKADGADMYQALEEEEYHLVSREYLKKSDRAADGDFSVSSGENPDNQAKIIEAGGKKYKFWLREEEGAEIINSSRLVYAKEENGSWGAAKAVDQNETADYDFDLAVNGSKIYVVWQDCKETFSDLSANVEEVAKAAEIKLAVIDTATDTVNILPITDNSFMDVIPAVTVIENKAYVVWYYTESGVLDNSADNYLKYVEVDGATVGTEKKINCGSDYVSKISAGIVSGRPAALYSLTDAVSGAVKRNCMADLTQAETQTVKVLSDYRTDGQSAIKEAEGAQPALGGVVSVPLNGVPSLLWYQDGNIFVYDGAQTQTLFEEDRLPAQLSTNFAVADNGTESYIVWSGITDAKAGTSGIYAARYDGTKCGPAYLLKEIGEESVHSLEASVGEDGAIHLLYTLTAMDEQGTVVSSRMIEERVRERYDAVLDTVDYDINMVEPGALLPLALSITNQGNQPFAAVCADLSGAGSYHKVIALGEPLLPGETAMVKIEDFALSTDLAKDNTWDLTIGVNACDQTDGSLNDEVAENGMETLTLGYANLYVEKEPGVIIDNEEYYHIAVKNDGRIEANNVEVRILSDHVDGQIVYTDSLESIGKQETRHIYLPETILAESDILYVYVTTSTPRSNAEDGGKYVELSCNNETVAIEQEVALGIEATPGGKIVTGEPGIYYSNEEIVVAAKANDGYVFAGWEVLGDGEFADNTVLETIFYMPNTDTSVRAVFLEEKTIEDIALESAEETLAAGDAVRLAASTVPKGYECQIAWSSSDETVAAVDNKGVVTAIKGGTAVVSAKVGAVEKTCKITVTDVGIESLRMVFPNMVLDGVGTSERIDVLVNPEGYSERLIWESSDSTVVSVDEEGTVTARAVGTATITVTAEHHRELTASCEVAVRKPLESISINQSSVRLREGEAATLLAGVSPADTTDEKTVSWQNYSSDVVSIETGGVNNEILTVKGLKSGIALIEAQVGDCHAYCTVEVFVPATGIALDVSAVTLQQGDSYVLYALMEPAEATETIKWSVSDENVVSLANTAGLRCDLEALAVGTAVVTARTESGLTASCTVTVTEQLVETVIVKSLADFQSPHNYDNNMAKVWSYTKPGAEQVSIAFSTNTKVEYGCDYIYILDQNNREIGVYTGSALAGKTVTVDGPTVKVKLVTDGSLTYYGFRVTAIREKFNFAHAVIDPIPAQVCTGAALTPELRVSVGGSVLTPNVDYTASYSNNVGLGVATVVVSGIAPSTGSAYANFTIAMPRLGAVQNVRQKSTATSAVTLEWDAVEGANSYRVYLYNTKKKKYQLKKNVTATSLKFSKLKTASAYKVQVQACFTYGKKTVTGAKKTYTMYTCTKAPAGVKASGKSKAIGVRWKKISAATGYQIFVSTKKAGGYKLTKTIGRKKTVKADIKKLKAKKVYYVKVRSYIKTKNGNVYSAFSKPVKVKTK